jgi:hypothetical protein
LSRARQSVEDEALAWVPAGAAGTDELALTTRGYARDPGQASATCAGYLA